MSVIEADVDSVRSKGLVWFKQMCSSVSVYRKVFEDGPLAALCCRLAGKPRLKVEDDACSSEEGACPERCAIIPFPRASIDVDLTVSFRKGVTNEKIEALTSVGRGHHHSRSQSWPISSFMNAVPGMRGEGEQKEVWDIDEEDPDDGNAVHTLDLESGPHRWEGAEACTGSIMGFLAEQRRNSGIELGRHENKTTTIARVNSCPQLARRREGYSLKGGGAGARQLASRGGYLGGTAPQQRGN